MTETQNAQIPVLIGGPHKDFHTAAHDLLSKYKLYQIEVSASCEDFLNLDFTPSIALIDGDININEINEWMQTLKMQSPHCATIVLHTTKQHLDHETLKKNGASEIMHLYFDEELIGDRVLELTPLERGQNIPVSALQNIDPHDLVAETEINFDVYIHLPQNNKNILFKKQGDEFDPTRLAKLKSENQNLYIPRAQKKQFAEYTRTTATLRTDEELNSLKPPLIRLKHRLFKLFSQFFSASSTGFEEGKALYSQAIEILSELGLTEPLTSDKALKQWLRFQGTTQSHYNDAIAVAAYTSFVCILLQKTPEYRQELTLAALFHNIGIASITPPYQLENPDYKKYPEASLLLIKSKRLPLPPEASDAIKQHRETNDGKGFPKNVTASDLAEQSRILSLVFELYQMTSLADHKKSLSIKNAIKKLWDESLQGSGRFDVMSLTQLKKIFDSHSSE